MAETDAENWARAFAPQDAANTNTNSYAVYSTDLAELIWKVFEKYVWRNCTSSSLPGD